MKIQRDTDPYNERRYGHPWIARVDFTSGAKGDFVFGEWCGQHGSPGTLYLDAAEGDVVAMGQKDHRAARSSGADYYIITAAGELESTTKADAYKHHLARASASSAVDPRLVALDEIRRLMARHNITLEELR